ncbi:MAG: type II toxin-antitoxin system PemK/MazF family toxin [Candidatus Parcubacteria bacterium]|nr:type II toxin-antitoxin system PemK/MazF family toxin [Candidatus Parcubacteria bacterium]
MEKDFDGWNKTKKQLEIIPIIKYVHPREIWWCSLGVNVGVEIDGKNENFERPVIVMKVYSKDSMIILPLITKQKDDKFHHKIQTKEKTIWVKLTQTKVISSKRLLRKVDILKESSFNLLTKIWKESL